MTKLSNYRRAMWALLRPQTYFLLCLFVTLGLTFGLASQSLTFSDQPITAYINFVSVLLALGLWYIAGTALNDYADFEADQVNLKADKQRPLVIGLVGKNDLVIIAGISSACSFLLAVSTRTLIIVALFSLLLALNVAYSLKPLQVSRRGALAQLFLPLGYVVLSVVSGLSLVSAPIDLSAMILVLAMYIHFVSRLSLKDHRDVVGDTKIGKITPVIKYGHHLVITFTQGALVISSLMLVVATWDYARIALPFICLITGSAFWTLVLLRSETKWPKQKPLITVYGRLCTGLVLVLIVCIVAHINNMNEWRTKALLIITTSMIVLSLAVIMDLQKADSSSKPSR